MSEDKIPVNTTDLAGAIKRSRSYVQAMRQGGYLFTHGNRTLVADALKWLRKNPDFRSTSYRWGKTNARKRPQHPQPVTAGKNDE
jgi:hypothetical protein